MKRNNNKTPDFIHSPKIHLYYSKKLQLFILHLWNFCSPRIYVITFPPGIANKHRKEKYN